jgi:Outer membrane protein beta-barrel domain
VVGSEFSTGGQAQYRAVKNQGEKTQVSASTTTRSLLLRTAVIAAAAMLGAVGTARAQTPQPAGITNLFDQGHWTATPFIGFGFSGDLDSASGALGVAGGYVWSSRVALEGEYNILPSSEAGGAVEVDSDSWSLTGNILYHFPGRLFVPYGVFGMGFGHGHIDPTDPELSGVNTTSKEFVVNFGAGGERNIRDRMAFRGDLRYFFGGNLVPDYWRFSAGLTFDLGHF